MPTGPGGPGQEADPIIWSTCPAGMTTSTDGDSAVLLDCGGVTVPVSYSDPEQGSFTLRAARARVPGLAADATPLVVIPGDPGQFGRSQIRAVASALPADVRQHFAIITVDLRGTGSSDGFDCVSDSTARAIVGLAADPTTSVGAAQLQAIARQLTFDCGDLVGPPLTQYNTTNAADDLDSLRSALGRSTLNLMTQGYGATLGAIYADRYPGRVDLMTLDTPTDPLSQPSDRAAASAKAAEGLLDDFAAACASFTGGCPLGSNPRDTITKIVSRLAVSGDRSGEWTITGGSVLLALLAMLPNQSQWPDLAKAIAALDESNPDPLAALLVDALGGDQITEHLTGRILFSCNDSTQRLSDSDISSAVSSLRSSAPLFGPISLSLAGLCSAWPAPDAAIGAVKAAGAPGMLVLGAVKNSTHPYSGVQSLAGQLASAVLVSWQSGADTTYPTSGCVTTIVDAYLLQRTMPAMGTLCPP
jgi:pimeloyl-ACP methyl ester carboxylesterase